MNYAAWNTARTFATSKNYLKTKNRTRPTSISICLICAQQGYHSIAITSCQSCVTASGTPLIKFLNKIIGEEPCYSISTLICQHCYLLLNRLDTYQARAAEIHNHISTRYRDTKFEFIGNRQRISELITSSLSNIKSFKTGTTLNVSDELSITVFHEALSRSEIRNKNSSTNDRENLVISDSDSSHIPNINNNYLKRKRNRTFSRNAKDVSKKQKRPLVTLKNKIDKLNCVNYGNDSEDLSNSTDLNSKASENQVAKDLSNTISNSNDGNLDSMLNGEKCDGSTSLPEEGNNVESKPESSSNIESDNDSDSNSSSSDSKKKQSGNSSSSTSSDTSSISSSIDSSSSSSSSESSDDEDEKVIQPGGTDSEPKRKNDVNKGVESELKPNQNKVKKAEEVSREENSEPDHSTVVIKLEKADSAASNNEDLNAQNQEIRALDSHFAEAVLMQNSLATNLLQSFLSTSMWMNSSESSNLSENNNHTEHNLNHIETYQKTGQLEDITAGTITDKKRRLELKNTGQSYINTKGALVEAKRVWPQDCSRCPLKCNSRLSEEKRRLVFADYWGLADYDRQREYLAKQMEREERVGPSGHTRTVVLYFLTHMQKKIQVCRQFFLKTLDVSEKASRIVLEKKLKGEFEGDGTNKA